MNQSGRNNPCPSCGRTRDGDCRWNAGAIWCHQGSHNGPDPSLSIGDTITIDGKPWALVSRNSGFAGSAALFRPHRERRDEPRRHIPRRQRLAAAVIHDLHRLDHAVADFEALLDEALNIPPLEEMFDSDIKTTRDRAEQAMDLCLRLIARLERICKLDQQYQPVLDQMEEHKRDLSFQLADLNAYCDNPADYWEKHLLNAPTVIPDALPKYETKTSTALYWATPDPNYKPRDPVVQQLYAAYREGGKA